MLPKKHFIIKIQVSPKKQSYENNDQGSISKKRIKLKNVGDTVWIVVPIQMNGGILSHLTSVDVIVQ